MLFQDLRFEFSRLIVKLTADWDIQDTYNVFHKIIIIIPKGGYKKTSLTAYDPNIVPVVSRRIVGGKPLAISATYHQDRAGHPDKDYSSPLFHTQVDGEVILKTRFLIITL